MVGHLAQHKKKSGNMTNECLNMGAELVPEMCILITPQRKDNIKNINNIINQSLSQILSES
jgi:hypothetical protein